MVLDASHLPGSLNAQVSGKHLSKYPDKELAIRIFSTLVDSNDTIFSLGLSKDQVKLLALLAKARHYSKGQFYCREGENRSEFAVVIDGEFTLQDIPRHSCSLGPGSFIGEVGLLGTKFVKCEFCVRATIDSTLVTVPYRKYLTFIANYSETEARTLEFLNSAVCSNLMKLLKLKKENVAARMLQCAQRSHRARSFFHSSKKDTKRLACVAIQRMFRKYRFKMNLWLKRQIPRVEMIQCAVRSWIARRVVREIRAESNHEQVRKAVSDVNFCKYKVTEWKKMKIAGTLANSVSIHREDSSSAVVLGQLPTQKSDKVLGKSTLWTKDGKLEGQQDSAQATNVKKNDILYKWLRRTIHKSFRSWALYIQTLKDKIQRGKKSVKHFLYGPLYYFFGLWSSQRNSKYVSPWRAAPGKTVILTHEGKEYEYTNGHRVAGDNGVGVLLEPLLSSKALWKVQWVSSGLISSYFTGSCGRYFLQWWKGAESEMQLPRVHSDTEPPASLVKIMEQPNQAEKNVGQQPQTYLEYRQTSIEIMKVVGSSRDRLEMTRSVTVPFGAKYFLPCPPASEWALEMNFEPNTLEHTARVSLRASEATLKDCGKGELGIIVSPLVEVRVDGHQLKTMKPFQVKIPHRCSSTSHLNLYHWSVGKMFPEKILSAEFSTDYCTATVEAFGVFAVLNGQPSTPDVLYAKLDVGDLYRDNIGKLVTKVHFGKTFSGRVLLVPRGSACSTAVPCMSFLPRFLVRNGSTVDKIELEPLKKLKGYTLNSWSNRQAYIGRMFIINFSFIVQAVAGIHAPTRLPMVDCKVILFSSRGQELLTFENGNEIRIQVTTTDLKIYVSFEERLAPMSYTCTLQGRESLRDIRVWVAKCIGGNEIEPLALSRFSNLRFVSADRSDYLSLSDECFEHASAHLPEVRLQALTKLDVRYGSEGDVVDMLQDVFMRTRQAPLPKEISQRSLPSLKSKSGLSQQLTLGRKMPLLGCPTSDDWTQPSVDSLARYKELSKELDRHGGAHLDKRARNLEGTVANESKWLRSGFLTSREESSRRTRLPRLPLDQVHSLRNRSRLDGFFTSR